MLCSCSLRTYCKELTSYVTRPNASNVSFSACSVYIVLLNGRMTLYNMGSLLYMARIFVSTGSALCGQLAVKLPGVQ